MTFKVTFSESPVFNASFGSIVEVPVTDYYDGPYHITPSPENQIIPIIGLTAKKNITVSPIPSNYGLITWNGAVLTVS